MGTNAFPVSEMTVHDIVPDLTHMLDGSPVDVDGITIVSASPHPAFDPDGAAPGSGAMLVTFADVSGRRRVAELQITVAWREDSCWHTTTRPGELGEECCECGMVTTPTTPEARCPECQSPVTDPVGLFGVHTVSCGVVMCQCEHEEHERGGMAHRYLGVRAGSQRALHVGRICDSCAGGHLADYLVQER